MDETLLHSSRAALLNIDMQHFFVEGAPDGLLVLERINRLAATCRRAHIAVIHTVTPFPPQVAPVEYALALHHALAIDPTDTIFVKYHFSAFHESDLERILQDWGVDTLIISGIRTNVCCAATAWEAIARQFTIYFLRDGTATKEMGGIPHTYPTYTITTSDLRNI
jgi:isochorismate hydrolase